jgi:hypothetical protein
MCGVNSSYRITFILELIADIHLEIYTGAFRYSYFERIVLFLQLQRTTITKDYQIQHRYEFQRKYPAIMYEPDYPPAY